jgi:hypothetical protein
LPGWQGHRHEGYRAITVDVTAFWRPALQNCPSKHYHPAANRALPAVIFGVIGEVGQIGGQRLACPLAFERVHPKDPSESRLWRDLLRWVRRHLAADAVAVMDAGVKLPMRKPPGWSAIYCAWRPTSLLAAIRLCPKAAKGASQSMARRSARWNALTKAKRSQPAPRIEWKPG